MQPKKTIQIANDPWIFYAQTAGSVAFMSGWAVAGLGCWPYNLVLEMIGCACWVAANLKQKQMNYVITNSFIFCCALAAVFTN